MDEADAAGLERFARMALAAIQREYPNKILHVLASDADVRPPRELTPAFFGAFDWHSSVHGHWTLARLLKLWPDAPFARDAASALDRALDPEKIAGELGYLRGAGRGSYEVPYGMGWLLTLASELRDWSEPSAERWRAALEPLEALAAERMAAYLSRLPRPVRSGEHTQSAFGLCLYWDWATLSGNQDHAERLASRVRELFAGDRDGPLHLEPSGYDFLSPCLGEADCMRRVLAPDALAAWLARFLPTIPDRDAPEWLPTATCPDPSDDKLSHLVGLNLSRAWMLRGVASALPADDRRRAALEGAAERHRAAGLAGVTAEHYAGSHWQGTFAVYLLTERALGASGLDAPPPCV